MHVLRPYLRENGIELVHSLDNKIVTFHTKLHRADVDKLRILSEPVPALSAV